MKVQSGEIEQDHSGESKKGGELIACGYAMKNIVLCILVTVRLNLNIVEKLTTYPQKKLMD